jgi:hypothetical protein
MNSTHLTEWTLVCLYFTLMVMVPLVRFVLVTVYFSFLVWRFPNMREGVFKQVFGVCNINYKSEECDFGKPTKCR